MYIFLISYHRLNKLLGDVVISQGGVVPHIDPAVCAIALYRDVHVLIVIPSSYQAKRKRERRARPLRFRLFIDLLDSLLYHYCIISLLIARNQCVCLFVKLTLCIGP